MLKTVFLLILQVAFLSGQGLPVKIRPSSSTTQSSTTDTNIESSSSSKPTENEPHHSQSPTIKVPLGYHSFLVAFMKKKNFDPEWETNVTPKLPKDFTTSGPFICSGTILTPRWVLTTANPLAFFPVDSYVMISNHYFSNDPDNVTGIDLDFAMVFPYYRKELPNSDVALVRTTNHIRFDFETRNVDVFNAGILTKYRFQKDCVVVIWTYNDTSDTFWRTELRQSESQDYKCKNFNKTDASLKYYCLDFSHLDEAGEGNLPCAINRGAPMVCNTALMGAYVGEDNKGPNCKKGLAQGTVHRAIKLDQYFVKSWIENVISALLQIYTNPLLQTLRSSLQDVVLKMCPS